MKDWGDEKGGGACKPLSIRQAAIKMGVCAQTAKALFVGKPGVGKYPGKNGREYYRIPIEIFNQVDAENKRGVKCAAECTSTAGTEKNATAS